MKSKKKNTFDPDYAISPGEILNETLIRRNMKRSELSEQTGLTEKCIDDIIKGKVSITQKIATRLARVLGIRAVVWNTLEMLYHAAHKKGD